MNCARFESLIALYVEGDLAVRQARDVEAHLAECAACRDLAAALGESQSGVKGFRGEAVDELVLEQVRRRVLEQVALRPRPAFAWPWKYAVAGLAVAMVVAIFWHGRPEPAPVRKETSPPPVAVESKYEPPAVAAPVAQRRRPRKDVRRALVETEPLIVKLVTDDPDIVILWIIDRKGD